MVLYLIEDNTQGCCIVTEGLVGYLEGYFEISFLYTKPKPAYGRQDLYLIVGPEHSFRVFSMWKMKNQPGTLKTNLEPLKPTWNHE